MRRKSRVKGGQGERTGRPAVVGASARRVHAVRRGVSAVRVRMEGGMERRRREGVGKDGDSNGVANHETELLERESKGKEGEEGGEERGKEENLEGFEVVLATLRVDGAQGTKSRLATDGR